MEMDVDKTPARESEVFEMYNVPEDSWVVC